MSALLGLLGPGTADSAMLSRLLERLRPRGGERVEVWHGPGVTLAVMRPEWQLGADFAAGEMVVGEGDLVIVADASIYYRDELLRRLGRSAASIAPTTPARLILAAYRKWGGECLDELEGDYAFLIWDKLQRRLVWGRDFAGTRPLFSGRFGNDLVVATAASAVAAHPAYSGELNRAVLAEAAAGLLAAHLETVFSGVYAVPVGSICSASEAGDVRRVGSWTVPVARELDCRPIGEAAAELRVILQHAVGERLIATGDTAVWLSGGRDSTAVFAAGRSLLEARGREPRLWPISVSYPEGDPGREDELIVDIAERWDAPVEWVNIADVHILPRVVEQSGSREDPSLHPFEEWNRTLARRSALLGCRVALTGLGGDEFFDASDIYLADLLRAGRITTLVGEWKARGRPSRRDFTKEVVAPLVPTVMRRVVARARGIEPEPRYLERRLPPWIRRDFATSVGLAERQRHIPPRGSAGFAGAEFVWFLTHPLFAALRATVGGFALESGTELRLPLFDARVVHFAARRPVSDRKTGQDRKRLLRDSMTGLLPEHVLAPRNRRTGMTTGYLVGEVAGAGSFIAAAFKESMLAELGIVDPGALQRGWEEFERHRTANQAAILLLTLAAELWLQGRFCGSEAPQEIAASS